MAPITRGNALVPRAEGLSVPSQAYREHSWQFVGSETQSEREPSEEPPSSYDEEVEMASGPAEELGQDDMQHDQFAITDSQYPEFQRQAPLVSTDDHEDILHPLREAANRVGREVERFAEVLDGYNPQRITGDDDRYEMMLELIDEYHSIALETVKQLRGKHADESKRGQRPQNTPRGDEMDLYDSNDDDSPLPELKTNVGDLERWEDEAQTWDLLRRLIHLRFPKSRSAESAPKDSAIHQYSSEREIWESFLESEEIGLERKTVLEWLKDGANELGEDIDVMVQDLQQNADRGEMIAHGWLHTTAALKQQNLLPLAQRTYHNSSRTQTLITELDPDATTRQKRNLEDQDEYFERSIWLGCYEMLRRGKTPAELREWCTERTEVWRAISMSGFPDEDWDDEDASGNSESSSLWRKMCYVLASNSGTDDYKRAVFGILSGDIRTVEPVCRTWNDFLFANYNALLRSQFENFAQQVRPPTTTSSILIPGVPDATQAFGSPETANKKVVDMLKSDPRTQAQSMQPMKMLQGVLIGDSFPDFIYQQGLALSKAANATGVSKLLPPNKKQPEREDVMKYIALDDHDSLRVLAHMLLIFIGLNMDLGGVFRETEVQNIIVAYVSFLRLAGKEELIPLYCSQLSGTRKYAILCRNLIDVTNHEARETQIELMKDLGLDVQEFVSLQARYLVGDYKDTVVGYPARSGFKIFEPAYENNFTARKVKVDFFGDDPDCIERIDMLLIRSMEWYLLVDGMWTETFAVGTALYLRFFKNMRLNAARTLSLRMPSAEIAKAKTAAILGYSCDLHGLEAGDDGDVTEVLDGSASQKRLLKQHLLAQAKSYKELESLIDCLDILETASSMASLHNQYEPKDYKKKLGDLYQPAILSIQPLLRGWLLTSQNTAYTEAFRQLREAYLPETILAYISILQFGGRALTRDYLIECMELSSLIAEEGSDLLELFTKTKRMEELVELLALSSKSLLLASTATKSRRSKSKKLRLMGRTQELWNVQTTGSG